MSTPRVICTIGVHRSGTSLVSRLVNLLGVDLGPAPRVVTAGEDNPTGYWEYRPFVDINDDLLQRFGGHWDQPPTLPSSWVDDPRLDDLKEKARKLVATDFSGAPLWGWKDPRACVTLPFWQDVIGPMRYVICVRNPSAVVASLTSRDGRGRGNAEHLWLTHMRALLADTSGQPRLFVSYEDLLEDWRPELRRLAAFIGTPERAEDPRVHEAVSAFLARELCHHHVTMEALANDEEMSFETIGLAFALRAYVGRRDADTADTDAVAPMTFDDMIDVIDMIDPDPSRRRAQQALDRFATRALDSWTRTMALTAAHYSQTRTAASTSETASARAMVNAMTNVPGNVIANVTTASSTVIAGRYVHLREHQAVVQALEEIHASRAWRLVTVLHDISMRLLPAGSRRQRVLHSALSSITKRLAALRGPRAVDRPVL